MGDDSLILREDGYIRMNFPVTSLTYHSNLNIILVKTDVGGVHVLDVNSGVILQSSCLSADDGGTLGVEYAAGADRVFVWDSSGVGARTDYYGVLLLHTALQRPLPSSQPDKIIRVELVLSEAVLLYQCLQSLDVLSIEGLTDFINELKNSIDAEPSRKGVKAQKWSTVTICLPQSTVRLVTTGVVQELKGQNRRIPALAIASAVGQRANELVPCSRDEETRPQMYSEAERKETFKRWPHMDYKWALPARMAQAGFYHQPSPSGDDRAMCFTCLVCLVCWEKSDEPWVEHERHSPNCPFVRGEYTHNVPIPVTNATACAVPSPNVTVVSKGNTGDLIATGTTEGKVNIWKFDCGLKLVKFIHLSPYDSIFSGILATDCNKVWSTSLEKDTSTYGIELTAMAFVGMTSKQEAQGQTNDNAEKEINTNKTKPALICAVTVTRSNCSPSDQPIKEDSSKALFDSGDKSKESVQAMNDQNEAKSNLTPTNKMLFLLTYDIHSSLAGSITTVVHTSNSSGNSKPGGSKKACTVARTDDANIYDEIYFQYSDDDTDLPQCTNSLIDEQISNVINLNASSSKEDCKIWEPKKIIFTKHFKVLTPPPPTVLLPELPESGQGSMLDFVGKISQMKSWKSANLLDSVGTKLADQTDAVLQQDLTHYLNMNGPLEISDLKWYEGGDGTEKVKVTTFGGGKVGTQTAVSNSNNDGFESDPPQEEVVSQGIAIQCLSLPTKLNLRDDSKVTHLLPTEDKEHLLVVISCIEPDKIKVEEETDPDGDIKMEVDEVVDQPDRIDKSDAKAYFLLYKINSKTSIYTLEDNPVGFKELPFNESPVDLCLLPIDKHEQYSFAAVGVDGSLRLYSLPDFKMMSEKRVSKGQFTSVAYCASVERLSVSTKHGMIYFYALNNGEKDSTGDIDEDEFANIDFDMLQKAPRDEVCGPVPAPVILANKTDLDMSDLESLISLTGFYGTNTTVPYSAVVPGFWCELSPAQRSRSDHQNNRTWRLQNTSSTWDEHVLELTLPYSVSLAHIEFGFTLHTTCSANLPIIQVTLLKQNLHGIGYKKDASFGHRSESPLHFPVIDADMSSNLENPVNSEEYLQAHNAEILAGPLLLSSGLDLTQQSGTLILTSPRLYRARGRTFLIHIKTLFDPAKDMNKGSIKTSESSKKSGFIGCDWLHQISLTVRSSPHTDVPMERQQRIAMLESNTFLNSLFEIVVGKGNCDRKKIALDLLIWVISIRLQRMRLAKSEKGKDKDAQNPVETQQLECVKIVEKHTDALIKNCILCANRSIAKKCIKIILITSEGVKQLPKPWKSTFETSLVGAVSACVPYVGACASPGALRWLVALAQHATPRHAAPRLVAHCLALLESAARCLRDRGDVYHYLLRARFGLYGLPLERTIFASEVPELGRGSSSPVTYASVLAGDSGATTTATAKPDYQLKDLLNLPDMGQAGLLGFFEGSASPGELADNGKSTPANTKPDTLKDLLNRPPDMECKTPTPSPTSSSSQVAWWAANNGVGVFGAGLSEAMPLHVTCHVASDGTKLESHGARHYPAVVSSMPAPPVTDHHQLWSAMKEGQKQNSQDPDSLEDVESSLMDCDPQEKSEFSEDKLFKEQEQCGIAWAALVTRPPQHTLVVERMHSGARRYIVLDFGHTVRLTDLIIPSCSDLVTLCIDIWVMSEETDCVKLAFATDIASKHLVLTDIQPPPLCRYMKITTIGRYGMSAMKCKIPLGWFYGEIADIANVQASVNALNALHQDLTCRFRLATGKLMDLLNPYLEMYNGNAAHMMAYLNLANDTDPKVVTAYQECIELQQQLHTCNNILKKLQNNYECDEQVLDMINKGKVTSEALLERASTDKLRVITENVVDMLLYFYFQMGDVQYEEVSQEWWNAVCPLIWQCGARPAAALATLAARAAGGADWWGPGLAEILVSAFAAADAPPLALDRCLVLVIYMCRKSLYSSASVEHGPAASLANRTMALLAAWRARGRARPHSALIAALLTALAALLDSVAVRHTRWDWVTGGRAGSGSEVPRSECKLHHHRKYHKKLLHQVQEVDAKRSGAKQLSDHERLRVSMKTRMAMLSKRGSSGSKSTSEATCGRATRAAKVIPPALGAALAAALVQHMLTADSCTDTDVLLLCAKVVGRLCALCGGASLVEPSAVLCLARLAVTLPPWPRHALTTLLQDLVEYESGGASTLPASEGESSDETWPASNRALDNCFGKQPRRHKGASVADVLADSFGLAKTITFNKPPNKIPLGITNIIKDMEDQLTAESDDSESDEKYLQYFLDAVKKETKTKPTVDNTSSVVSSCTDARLESGAGSAGGAGGAGESLARRALLATGGALAIAIRSPPPAPVTPPSSAGPAPRAPSSPSAGGSSSPVTSPPASRPHPPLTHTLYDVFRHLALEFHYQMDCTFMENVVSLWLTLNGSSWSAGGAWTQASLALPADTPRIRLASDTVNALLHSLCTLENISLRCWVLSMLALAWIATLPLQTEGNSQTMGRVILECEHFVPAIVKFITMNVNTDGAVASSEPYLGGVSIGAGAGAASALQSVLSRVVCTRGPGGALAALRIVCGVWRRDDAGAGAPSGGAIDLHHTLLRLSHPLLQVLEGRHAHHALALLDTVAHQSAWWVRESSTRGAEGGSDARLSGLLADVLAGGAGGRRAPLRRSVLSQLLHYCHKLLAVPLHNHHHTHHMANSVASPSASTSGESSQAQSQSQTDESKARHSQPADTTNVEDERKQQAARPPCVADTVLQHPLIMLKFYRTLSLCDGMNTLIINSGMGAEPSAEYSSLKEEVFLLVAHMANVASNPALMVPSLMEFLRKEEVVNLSQAMQQLIVRLLDKPEAQAAFVEAGGLNLAVEKLTAQHQSGPSAGHGLVSSLMNYLKLPPQLINLSTPACNKKNQPPVIETANGGLVNIAPLCTVACANPTAQQAEVLLEGGATGGRGACAARRMRAAAWSYHFFSADDASLALTLTLPYAAMLHEVHLQPHLTSLATCPGAVAIEAGCGGTLAPLGPPQNTAGMTFIRLVVARPVVCTTVQVRLYKPRDSSNMGLLQLKLLAEPAFNKQQSSSHNTNNWASVVAACSRSALGAARWAPLARDGALSALCACVVAGGAAGAHAQHALLAAARASPDRAPELLAALLDMDAQAHAHAFQPSPGLGRTNGSMNAVCEVVRQLCRVPAPGGAAQRYVQWLAAAAELWLRSRAPPSAALTHTLAEVLWTLKEERIMENIEQLITDDLFELIYTWVQDVPETSLLKEALDAVLCSMCYIRPELFRMLLEHMDIPMDEDESMEGLTDDTKVHVSPATRSTASDTLVAWRLAGWQLQTVAACAQSPAATLQLLHSRLPAAAVQATADFSDTKLDQISEQMNSSREDVRMMDHKEASETRTDLASMRRVCQLVDWMRSLCVERRLKDWLGTEGSLFWKPLLRLLCHSRPPESTWQEAAQYAQLEENTIRLFGELTVCHSANQKLFASTLHNILETLNCVGPEGISGFTRALILRLVLSAERARVALRWAGVGAAPPAAPGHPAARHHALLRLPLHITVRQLLQEHRPPMPIIDETAKLSSGTGGSSTGGSVLRSASDTAIMTVADAWELTLAAASASKDKRVKDVKNTSLKQQNSKKRQSKTNDASVMSVADELIETTILVQVAGLEGFVPASSTLGQLAAAAPHVFGPHLTLTLHLNINGGPRWEAGTAAQSSQSTSAGGSSSPNTTTSAATLAPPTGSSAVLREFGACGGLALVAARLPRPHAPPPPPPAAHHHHHDLDWVKLDDPYAEEVVELVNSGSGGGSAAEEPGCSGVPAHALLALGLLLKLPGYADALLDEGARAVHLLRLLLGVTHDEDGRSIIVGGGNSNSASGNWSLGTLPFRVVSRLLEAAALNTSAGKELRQSLLSLGAVRLVLACLAVFSHHHTPCDNSQASNGSSASKSEEKSQQYWAKGTGFGTGSTQQSWNVEQALVRQRTEEEHVTVLLQVLASYMNPGEKWPPEESPQEETSNKSSLEEDSDSDALELPPEFIDLIAGSSLVPAICSYLRNDSVLDMSRHIPLYVCVLRCARALHALHSRRLATALRPLPRLLHQMSRTTNSYATKLRMSKKNIFGKMTYSQRFSTSSNSELSEEDEGLASLIADIQATSALMWSASGEQEAGGGPARALSGAGREARYIDLMRTMQFETFEMLAECPESGFKFTVPYHFEGAVRAAGERAHPARMKRLAQEAATLATSLPLSYSSSVFVRTDTDRLDVMKVLITGPSDTPYANGCFILDVYFPAEYPAVPMLINLETTGRHSVRFNPNLYNDGKVCLSVLNTWHGRPEEKWNAHTSSFLQVLVSIQSLILVPEPYFNEPGYERSRGTRVGSSASLEYNSNIYQACVRWAMLDHLRSPEPCFKEVIQTHFWIKRNEIMQTVANWITELETQSGDERTQRTIQLNLMALKRHYVKLQEELGKLPVPAGLEELDEPFTLPAAPSPPPAPRAADDIDHDMEKIVSQVLD